MNRNPTEVRLASTSLALAGLALSMLMPSLDTSIANSGLPVLADAFHGSFQATQWIVLSYLLAITTVIVSAGRLGDLFGRRRLLLTGIALFTVASLACAVAPSLPLLIAARAAQGLGAAMMMVLSVALVGSIVSHERTGSAMGFLGSMSAIGTTLGPSLGGILIGAWGWRTIFLINVPIGVLNFVLARRYVPVDEPPAAEKRGSLDLAGTLLLAVTLGMYALAMTAGRGRFGEMNVVLLLAASIGVVAFTVVEMRAASPLLQLTMVRNAVLRTGLALTGVVSTVMMATLVVGPFYLSRALGLRPLLVGIALSTGPFVAALASLPAGRMVDRYGARGMTIAGLTASAVGCVALSQLPAATGIVGYLLPLSVVTAGYALFQAANNTSIMTDAGPSQRGVVSGMLSLSRNLGLITGASAMGALFSIASGGAVTRATAGAIAHGMRVTFGVAAVMIGGALIAAVARFSRAAGRQRVEPMPDAVRAR